MILRETFSKLVLTKSYIASAFQERKNIMMALKLFFLFFFSPGAVSANDSSLTISSLQPMSKSLPPWPP